jgi:hypothetical protein
MVLSYQKWTVLIPTSLVHNLRQMLCGAAGVSTAGLVAVPWYRLKIGFRALKGVRAANWRVECCAKRILKRADIVTATRGARPVEERVVEQDIAGMGEKYKERRRSTDLREQRGRRGNGELSG